MHAVFNNSKLTTTGLKDISAETRCIWDEGHHVRWKKRGGITCSFTVIPKVEIQRIFSQRRWSEIAFAIWHWMALSRQNPK
jgi:hypothetical protein